MTCGLDQYGAGWYFFSMVINVAEAEAKLSKLIDLVSHGESVTIAKNNRPLVDLVPHRPAGKRRLGLMRGQITFSGPFDGEDSIIEDMFYG